MTTAGVRWVGRVDNSDAAGPRFSWPGSGFVATFSGTSLDVKLKNSDAFVFQPVIDDQPGAQFAVAKGEASRTLATGLTAGVHTVALYRQTEGGYGTSQLLGVTVGGGALRAPKPASGRLIEVVGDSISCGYGDRGTSATCSFTYDTESHWDSYGAVAARQLNAEVSTVAFSGRGMYRNLDGSMTETLPLLYDRVLTGSSTPTWGFSVEPQAVVINLGTNDFGPGDPGAGFTAAYTKFVGAVRGRYPKALIVCALGSMVSDGYPAGEMRLTSWRGYLNAVIAARHAAGDDKVVLLEFSAQTPDQYGCDYHPNVAKQQLMGDALAGLLKTRLGW
jgi:lysophospholipase L1-like esterase